MSLRERVAAAADTLTAPNAKCVTCWTLDLVERDHGVEESSALSTMLTDPRWASAAISRALLSEYQLICSASSISRHRRQECAAPRV